MCVLHSHPVRRSARFSWFDRPLVSVILSLASTGQADGEGTRTETAQGAFQEDQGRGRRESMSQHSSLKSVGKIAAKRNVLKRFERVELLKKRGQWKEGDRGLGLRKTKADQ